jgi:hypothetical protein
VGGSVAFRGMANVLNNEKKQQILALGQLGWSLRRIQQATHVRRETISTYLKAAGVGVWPPGGWGRQPGSKPAIGVTTDFGVELSAPRPRVGPARDKAGLAAFAAVVKSLRLSSLDQVDNLKILQKIVATLEAAIKTGIR